MSRGTCRPKREILFNPSDLLFFFLQLAADEEDECQSTVFMALVPLSSWTPILLN